MCRSAVFKHNFTFDGAGDIISSKILLDKQRSLQNYRNTIVGHDCLFRIVNEIKQNNLKFAEYKSLTRGAVFSGATISLRKSTCAAGT